ncbi:NADAR family protein [Nonomuraea fuscirosea]|uniref:NADAR family protein n=1 Tax=Nonomuraea fuscirosea TaxID=1291556 RepID=UPI0011B24AE9|nr:NADAR family protein [Nonomuraea fuscirosea]
MPRTGASRRRCATSTDGQRPTGSRRSRAASNPQVARDLAAGAERRPHWPDVRLAVMADLLRAKFLQHPDLAEVLLATGDGRIHYRFANSPFWDTRDSARRNWIGRLLELVRAELVAERVGFQL